VIRRGFWLTVGAVAGIAGYRRASAVGRRLSGRLTRGGAPILDRHSLDRHSPDRHGPDRHGPDRHSPDRHSPDRHSPDRHSQAKPNRHSLDGRSLATQAIGFARDVREGMDLYMVRHSPPERPTLGARDLPPARRRSIPTNHDPRPKDGH
jgi:hypothetical protein